MVFDLLQSETLYRGRVFNLKQDLVRLPNGRSYRLDIIEHNPAVAIVPVDEQGQIWFVRQYRHAAGKLLLEIPAGIVETGETPEACARREIREEIGMSAREIKQIGEFFLAPGYSTEYMYIYLATGLQPDPLPVDEDEFLSLEKIPLSQAEEFIRSGDIQDAKTLVALFLARSLFSGG
ncbi:MAG: NUDIX hydrolase [Anaerolineales bacterium]|nr:NUDIX hydrolase [Anaerolineales bacterium]